MSQKNPGKGSGAVHGVKPIANAVALTVLLTLPIACAKGIEGIGTSIGINPARLRPHCIKQGLLT